MSGGKGWPGAAVISATVDNRFCKHEPVGEPAREEAITSDKYLSAVRLDREQAPSHKQLIAGWVNGLIQD